MSRIFLTGDLHGFQNADGDKLTSRKFPLQKELTKKDYVIILGDFGLLWNESKTDKYWRDWLGERNFTTLFLSGNHENYDRIDKLPTVEMFGNPVGKVNDSIYHLRHGYIYTIANKTFFTFGGGFSIDKARRTESVSWWAREMPSQEEYKRGLDQLVSVNNEVDYILTHSCSNEMFTELNYHTNMSHKINGEVELRNYFDTIRNIIKHKMWYFGHFHYDFLSDDHWQVMYNLVKEIKE